MKQKCNYIGYSIIAIALLSSFVIFFYYPSTGDLGRNFTLVVILLFIRYCALWAGIGIIPLRLLGVIKKSNNLIYIFLGNINICLGIFSWILYLNNEMVVKFLHIFIINLFIGIIIFIDVFLLKIIVNKPGFGLIGRSISFIFLLCIRNLCFND